ncbi:hypothetical protein TNIN_365431 [Trichonephila inaurata madagascariensis]|uniref:Uncharacterized protein n=1 Tax=Trichonephila inaurata madagascariensis TaxID=2747483 RepID=A0A8X6WUG1_9ARAC|nr:hypothetical protein TNIN_365431 [Trichonephila inaurata madagascariensis]
MKLLNSMFQEIKTRCTRFGNFLPANYILPRYQPIPIPQANSLQGLVDFISSYFPTNLAWILLNRRIHRALRRIRIHSIETRHDAGDQHTPNPEQIENWDDVPVEALPHQESTYIDPCPQPVIIGETSRKSPSLVIITDSMRDFISEITSLREFQDPLCLIPSSSSTTEGSLEILKEAHRIQMWPFDVRDGRPIIQTVLDFFTENDSMVARTSLIENDASIDVSLSGDKLVAFVPYGEAYMITIFSLKNVGQVLGCYGPVPTPVSISFSPLCHFLLIGLESERPSVWTTVILPDILIQMLSIEEDAENSLTIQLYRSFSRRNLQSHPPSFKIYQVKWLLNKESLFAVATSSGIVLVKPRDEVEEDLRRTTALSLGPP